MSFESKRNLRAPPPTPLQRIGGQTYALDAVQRRVAKATEKARAHPQIKGRKLTVQPTAAGDMVIAHGLGRKPEGIQITGQRGAAVTYTEGAKSTRTITLNFSGAGDLDLWVY